MANINDFKLVNIKSKKMYDFLGVDIKDIDDIKKSRIGFYHLILENIAGIREIEEVSQLIIDTDYNKLVKNKNIDDLGMDAIYINNDSIANEREIQLFNFKFRDKFSADKTKSEGDISRSTKFLEYICSDGQIGTNVDKIVKEKIEEIRECLESNKICSLTLYMVSNESKGFAHNSNEYINLLEKSYGMKIVNISLDDIIGFFNVVSKDKESKFMISPNDFLSFENDEKSTNKSYVIKLPLIELIRITASDIELANNYNFEDDGLIDNLMLDHSLLYDNVRGFLGDTRYNKNIKETLKTRHKDFFTFNNGITITAKIIDSEEKNSGKKYLFTLKNYQIVNGGQTIRSIYNFLKEKIIIDKLLILREAFILVRIFKIGENDNLKNYISEYTNSQNKISTADLKSVDSLQIQIEKYFKEEKILYVRKAGDIGDDSCEYEHRMSMERLAQILYSVIGFPDRASNQKKKLFTDYYDEIFKGTNFNLESAVKFSKLFYQIEKKYKEKYVNFAFYEQKVFYILYILENSSSTIEKAIEGLERIINDYDVDVSNARKLIQKGFKENLNGFLGIEKK